MADLQSCYFCGTGPGGSLASYGVVPSALDPSPDEQRSVVLCPDCRDKLTALLRPVVAASGTEPPSTAPSPVEGSDAPGVDPTRRPERPADPTPDEPASANRDDAADATAGSTADAPETADDADERAITFDESAGDGPANDAAGDDPADGSTAADAGTTASSGGGGSGLAGASAGETGGGAADDDASEDAGAAASSSSAGGGSAGDSSAGDGSAGNSPAGGGDGGTADDSSSETLLGDDNDAYRKVIRLLQNREFPVRRVEIEDLASNAYKLSPRECSDAIDAIIQKGLLVEDDGMLRRPGN